LHKKTTNFKNGIETLQKLGAHYNTLAQWFPGLLPPIPPIALGKFGKKE